MSCVSHEPHCHPSDFIQKLVVLYLDFHSSFKAGLHVLVVV